MSYFDSRFYLNVSAQQAGNPDLPQPRVQRPATDPQGGETWAQDVAGQAVRDLTSHDLMPEEVRPLDPRREAFSRRIIGDRQSLLPSQVGSKEVEARVERVESSARRAFGQPQPSSVVPGSLFLPLSPQQQGLWQSSLQFDQPQVSPPAPSLVATRTDADPALAELEMAFDRHFAATRPEDFIRSFPIGRLIPTEAPIPAEELEEEINPMLPLSVRPGLKTLQTAKFIQGLINYEKGKLFIDGNLFTPITAATQGFSRERFVSCGSSSTHIRELLYLDPDACPVLDGHYARFRALINSQMSTKDILNALMEYINKTMFPTDFSEKEILKQKEGIREFIAKHQCITTHSSKAKIPIISIDEFIKKGLANPRHKALVACFIIDRLIREQVLDGSVQFFRNNVLGGSHYWMTFIPQRKDEKNPPEKYYFDSSIGMLLNFALREGGLRLASFIGREVFKDLIFRTFPAAKIYGQTDRPY